MPLHLAIQTGQSDVVKLLIDYMADVNIQVKDKTPLTIAFNNLDFSMVKFLLENQANVEPGFLIEAVKHSQVEIVKMILERGGDVKDCDKALLFTAVENCVPKSDEVRAADVEIASVLLRHGADPNNRDTNGMTVLILAVFNEFIDLVAVLLNKARHDLDVFGVMPLHLAAFLRNEGICRLLLRNGAFVNARLSDGSSSLHAAFQYEFENSDIDRVVSNCRDLNCGVGSDPDHKHEKKRQGDCDMRYNCIKTIKLLIEYRASVNFVNDNGETPLHLVCMNEQNYHDDLVKSLLESGADINCKDVDGDTPLMLAMKSCLRNWNIEFLLKNGASVNLANNENNTPLHFVYSYESDYYSRKSSKPIVQSLIRRGADVNKKNLYGETPLILAFLCDPNTNVIEVLIKKGANVNLADNYGDTALHAAHEYADIYSSRAVDLLLKKRANVDCKNKNDETPLMLAFKILPGNIALLDLLLKANARAEDNFNPENEMKILKSEKVGNSDTTFYAFLQKSRNEKVRFIKDESVGNVFKSGRYASTFPFYAKIINQYFERTQKRMPVLKQCEDLFQTQRVRIYQQYENLFQTHLYNIPPMCYDMILDYLGNDNLRSLAGAFDPSVVEP